MCPVCFEKMDERENQVPHTPFISSAFLRGSCCTSSSGALLDVVLPNVLDKISYELGAFRKLKSYDYLSSRSLSVRKAAKRDERLLIQDEQIDQRR